MKNFQYFFNILKNFTPAADHRKEMILSGVLLQNLLTQIFLSAEISAPIYTNDFAYVAFTACICPSLLPAEISTPRRE